MVIPGNHEAHHNFTQFRNRFNMPKNEYNNGTSYYYSFDYGPVHWVMYNTETYYYYDDEDWIKSG